MARNLDFHRPRPRHDGESVAGIPAAMRVPPRPSADRAAARASADAAVRQFLAAGGKVKQLAPVDREPTAAQRQAEREAAALAT